MKYKIQKYIDKYSSLTTEAKKRFDMVKVLSKNFTVEDETARKVDETLAQLIELDFPDASKPSSKPSTSEEKEQPKKKKEPTEPHSSSMEDLEKSFNELYEALKDRKPSGGSIDPSDLQAAVQKAIKGSKISYEQLDEGLQDRISVQPKVIRYEIPEVETRDFKKPPIKSFQSIVDDVMMGNPVMLVGGAGTGKTYMAEMLVAKLALGREYITINCSQWTAPTEIIGGQTMDGYVEGKLIEAWKNGWVLILDELPKIDPNTAGLFNDALAKTKVPDSVIFNSKKESFKKHKNFACIATGNIYPDKESTSYGANNKQDLSLLDRFSGSVYFIEKNPEIERAILQNDMIWSICDKLRMAIEELKYEAQLSLRFMQNARDTFNLEKHRIDSKGKNGLQADEGKTFKSAIDSYLSTFTEVQRKNLKDKIRYSEIFSDYEYRDFETDKMLY